MPTNTTSRRPSSAAWRSAAPVKSPTSTKQTSGVPGSIRIAACSVRPPVASTRVGSPWAAITDTACTTEARHDSVENGRTTPVVPRMLMPPRMPSRAFVVLRARSSPSGTLIVTSTPRTARSTTAPTLSRIICRGTGLMAGPPTSRPSPGLVTTPTPTPPSRWTPGASDQRTVAVRWAPWVTSGSSPASLTTTASARDGPTSHRSTANGTTRASGRTTSTAVCTVWLTRAVVAARAAAALHVPVVQPLRRGPVRTFAVRGRSGSRSSGPVTLDLRWRP